jgi:hypothetical protein
LIEKHASNVYKYHIYFLIPISTFYDFTLLTIIKTLKNVKQYLHFPTMSRHTHLSRTSVIYIISVHYFQHFAVSSGQPASPKPASLELSLLPATISPVVLAESMAIVIQPVTIINTKNGVLPSSPMPLVLQPLTIISEYNPVGIRLAPFTTSLVLQPLTIIYRSIGIRLPSSPMPLPVLNLTLVPIYPRLVDFKVLC